MDSPCSEQQPPAGADWSRLNSDVAELILSRLPVTSIVRASAVCKGWHSLIAQPSFAARLAECKKPWFFLYGQNNVFVKNNQAYGFDPEANLWIRLSTSSFPRSCAEESLTGSGGFLFMTTGYSLSSFCYTPVLKSSWRETAPPRFSRREPLVGVFKKKSYGFIVVGGVRFIGGLVDIEDRLAVEIYDSGSDSWELGAPLPIDFPSGNSSQCLSSAMLNDKFYVFGISSGHISAFDLQIRAWESVRVVRPQGMLFSFLVACQNRLILAGLCNTANGPSFTLWRIEEETMGFSEVGIMPRELLHSLFDIDEDDRFASLKCVGLGSLIYVFNEEHHRMYPACVCEISPKLSCTWTRVPALPSVVNRFHRVISFCSTVALDRIL